MILHLSDGTFRESSPRDGFYSEPMSSRLDFDEIFRILGGHREIVEILLEKGANIDTRSTESGTALEKAASRRHREIVSTLLHKGADVNVQNGYYGPPVYAAAANRQVEIVRTPAGIDYTKSLFSAPISFSNFLELSKKSTVFNAHICI